MHYKKKDLEIKTSIYEQLEKACANFEKKNPVSHSWS